MTVYTTKEFAALDLSTLHPPRDHRAEFVRDGEASLATVAGEWVLEPHISVNEVREKIERVRSGVDPAEEAFDRWLFDLQLDYVGICTPGRSR